MATVTASVAVAAPLLPLDATAGAAAAPIGVSIGDAASLEGSVSTRTMRFPVTLSARASTKVTVRYDITGGTARAGSGPGGGTDVLAASGTVTFTPSGSAGLTPVSRTVTVKIFGDQDAELAETFTVGLSNPTGGVTLQRPKASGTILNDDTTATALVGVGDGSVVEGNLDTTRSIAFNVTLSRPVTTDVTVAYALADGSASGGSARTVGADYDRSPAGTLRFAAGGTTTRTVNVPVWADVVAEPKETFKLNLSSVAGPAMLFRATGTGSILDDDSLQPPGAVSVCGLRLCASGAPWSVFGATFYNPGLTPYRHGIKDAAGTVALARYAHLNTLRITNFLDRESDPATAGSDEPSWQRVDAMIAAAHDAGLHVSITLSDYRKILWDNCINPYTADWSQYVGFVSDRINTVSHVRYRDDPTIAYVSISGEPQQTGTYSFTASATGAPCTISYSTAQLTEFYRRATAAWKAKGGSVLVNAGGFSYIDLPNSGIDWKAIFSLPSVDFCNIKTYGGMLAWAPTAVDYCRGIGKPILDEEFGWKQSVGDATRGKNFASMYSSLATLGFAGVSFWNLGYELAPTSYEVNPDTPRAMAAIQAAAP